MEHYEVCVMGGGPAGYAAAMRAVDFKKKTVLIEKSKVGGTGIYNGALSSKTLWEISQKVNDINESIASKGRKPFDLSWDEVKQTVKEAIFDRKIQYIFLKNSLQFFEDYYLGMFLHIILFYKEFPLRTFRTKIFLHLL